MNCQCSKRFEVRLCRGYQYAQFKRQLDIGDHPAFIGRDSFSSYALNGGALMYFFNDAPAGVSLVNSKKGILVALNIHPQHRGHGLGSAIMRFLIPNFARVIESRVPWFESLGYQIVGSPHTGQSLKTFIMVRKTLFSLVGNLKKNLEKKPDKIDEYVSILTHENIASDAFSKMVRPDSARRKDDRVSLNDGVLEKAIGGNTI